MRALTVHQPWAWAIVHGGKNIENRTIRWTYRGPLLIHAGLRSSASGLRSNLIRQTRAEHRAAGGDPTLHTGCIIGIVDLVDVHPEHGACCAPWGETRRLDESDGATRGGLVHLVLDNPRALDPIPCTGMRSLWHPPPDIVETLR
jgi:hypothetical protein